MPNSSNSSVVIFSSYADTTQALRNVLQGHPSSYFTQPIGEISRVLTDATFRPTMPTVQLWWIDVDVFRLDVRSLALL